MAIFSPATRTQSDPGLHCFVLTYDELCERLRRILKDEGRKVSYVANFFTALNG